MLKSVSQIEYSFLQTGIVCINKQLRALLVVTLGLRYDTDHIWTVEEIVKLMDT